MFTEMMMSAGGGVPQEYPLPVGLAKMVYPLQKLELRYNTSSSVEFLSYLYFECNSTNNYSWYIYSTSPVDLTDYSKLVVEGNLPSACTGGSYTQGIQLGLTNSTPSTTSESDYVIKEVYNSAGDFKLELDVSSITSGKYIKLCCLSQVNKGYLYRIYLLK